MKPYHQMDHETLEREYSPSSCVQDIMVYINQYIEKSEKARETCAKNFNPDIKYAPEERAAMDIFIPDGDGPFPIHVFIHGGYWQKLSKNESHFAAKNFLDHNIIYIALDYTLTPEANMFEIVDQARCGILSVLKTAHTFKGDMDNVTLSGSSAGGHLVAEVISMDWKAQGYDHCPLKGALMISGIFDLEPLVNTYVNDPLKMDIDDATALSPLYHIPKNCCPLVVTYGENETDEFKRQSHEYMDACLRAGLSCRYIDMPSVNHFNIVFDLNKKHSPLFQAVLHQIEA